MALSKKMRFIDLIGTTSGGHYQINTLIGKGGVSAIFEAHDTDTGQKVAVKVMAVSQSEQIHKQRFEREANLVRKLNHPNICQLYEYWLDDNGIPFMAIELIEGKTIAQLTETYEPLEKKRAIDITYDICRGLDYAHKHGIVHRDLKPENVMLKDCGSPDEIVKILDFGLAKNPNDSKEEKLTQTGWVPGTPGFMSPEQIMGKKIDGRSDLYSLACLLYLMLTGKEIFEHKSPIEMMRMHAKDEPSLEGKVPGHLLAFFHIALKKNPDERFKNATEFAEGLSTAASQLR